VQTQKKRRPAATHERPSAFPGFDWELSSAADTKREGEKKKVRERGREVCSQFREMYEGSGG